MIDLAIQKTYACNEQHFHLDFSSRWEPGSLIGLQGPSGCGKTTVLRCLAGLSHPDKGHILVNSDYWYRDFPRYRLVVHKRNAAYMFPDFALFPHMTVIENLIFAGANIRRAEELIEMVCLTSHVRHYPHELSSGQQQRVAFARALAQNSRLLLLDEPFSALHENIRNLLGEILKSIQRKENLTVVLVSHSSTELAKLCDSVTMLA